MKAPIYESLHAISQAAEQIGHHIERLKAEGLLAPQLADIRRLAIEQLRAEVSLTALLNLADRERRSAGVLEKERIEHERRLGGEQS